MWRHGNTGLSSGQWPHQAVQTGRGHAQVCRHLHQVGLLALTERLGGFYQFSLQAETLFPRDCWQCCALQEAGQHYSVMAREVQEQSQVYNAWCLVSTCKYTYIIYYIYKSQNNQFTVSSLSPFWWLSLTGTFYPIMTSYKVLWQGSGLKQPAFAALSKVFGAKMNSMFFCKIISFDRIIKLKK